MKCEINVKFALKTILLIICFLAIFASSSWAWLIKNYDVDIKVEKNSDLFITERLIVDFGNEKKHGIYRDIPLEFKAPNGKKKKIQIKDIFVTDEQINPYQTKISQHQGNLRIRIGDPNKFVSGIQKYIIRYKVKYALYKIGNIDELYWNAIGTGWAVPILSGSATVVLPFDHSSVQSACYTGKMGSRERACEIRKNANEVFFNLKRQLAPYEGITVAVGWQAGLIPIESGPPFWKNPWLYAFIYIIGLFVFLFYLWWNKGRDVGGRGVIQVQYYPPEGLTPIEAGVLIDEKIHTKDIIAEIIDLARRGYIKIIETEEKGLLFGKKRDYIFEKIKAFDEEIRNKPFDMKILSAIFEGRARVRLSELKKEFYTSIPTISNSVFQNLTNGGFFFKNPLKVRNIYAGIGVLCFILSILLTIDVIAFNLIYNPLPLLVCGVITALSLFIFGQFMPRKTHRGTLMKEYLKGYEEFISKVEKDVIERLFPPDKIPEIFEITLPYAIAFGEAKKWTEAFEGLFYTPPKWYEGRTSFSPSVFANSIDSFISNASQVLPSTPSSSGSGGGGSSGGGGGGGGGGSW